MSHGNSPAAWTAVAVALVGVLVCAVAFIPHANWVLFIIGAVLVLASLVVGKVMSAAGMGAKH